jgi:hypothetical protein
MGGAGSMHRREETFVQLWLGSQKFEPHGRRWEGNIKRSRVDMD